MSRQSPTSPEASAAQATASTQLANTAKKLRTNMSANMSPVQVSAERAALPPRPGRCSASPGSNCAASSAGSPRRAAVSSSE